MDLQKGSIKCTSPNCGKEFTWVYQTRTKNKATVPVYVVDELYEPKENEAMVSGDNLKCYCPNPKCGTPHFINI